MQALEGFPWCINAGADAQRLWRKSKQKKAHKLYHRYCDPVTFALDCPGFSTARGINSIVLNEDLQITQLDFDIAHP